MRPRRARMPAVVRAVLGAALAIAALVGAVTPGNAQDQKTPVVQQPMYGTAPRDYEPVKADEIGGSDIRCKAKLNLIKRRRTDKAKKLAEKIGRCRCILSGM